LNLVRFGEMVKKRRFQVTPYRIVGRTNLLGALYLKIVGGRVLNGEMVPKLPIMRGAYGSP
jgi:hypothetical protein